MSGSSQEMTKSKSMYPKTQRWKLAQRRRIKAIFLILRDWVAFLLRMNVGFGKEKSFERDT